ncbi:chemotaxis protein CheW [Acidobacteria bacterium ACD]|nr:MAG: chemotaxis protein CheW [Acidobacteriota bacterium]MDL1950892.1 chemotaxis protein CheW [Acidobacteria bacterium ACD]
MTRRPARATAAARQSYLSFVAGGARFGVPLDRVHAAAQLGSLTPLPGAPPEYAGLSLVRGAPVGVLDAARALGLPPCGSPRARPVLILFDGDPRALLVDRVDGIEEIDAGRIAPPPPGSSRVSGLVPEEGRFLSLVDVDALLGGGGP